MKSVTPSGSGRLTGMDRKASATRPDDRIVADVLAGDTEAFRELVERHQQMLVGVLTRILADPDEALEAAQDTFVKAYTNIAGFRAKAKFSTWLLQIGVNLARDRHRRRQLLDRKGVISLEDLGRRQTDAWEPADRRPGTDQLQDLAGRQEWEFLVEALAELPPEFREVFTLKHIEGLGYGEIALMTGDSPGTLKVRAHRARRRLQRKLEARGVSRKGSAGDV